MSDMHRPTPLPTRLLPNGRRQESVWDYPRPPLLAPSRRRVVVAWSGRTIADTNRAIRVCETSHPPTWAIPPEDVDLSLFEVVAGRTQCEWKGEAHYLDLVLTGSPDGQAGELRQPRGAWSYASPRAGFEPIASSLFIYPGKVDLCTVDGEPVTPQDGEFYGGWITSDVVGPFKGAPGSEWW